MADGEICKSDKGTKQFVSAKMAQSNRSAEFFNKKYNSRNSAYPHSWNLIQIKVTNQPSMETSNKSSMAKHIIKRIK